jgi:NADH-quinone oxidoreductase subunit N
VIHRPHIDWLTLAPPSALFAAAAIILLAAVILPRGGRRPFGAILCAIGFVVSFVFAAVLYRHSPHAAEQIGAAIRRDRFGALAQMIVAGSGLLAVGISYGERSSEDHIGEYYAILAAAGAGMAFFVTANNFLTLFLALEWFSIALYVLCAVDRTLRSGLEAALKYLVVGGFGSAVLLFGTALVYGSTGSIRFGGVADAVASQGLQDDALLLVGLAMILAGLGFKASAAPFHMWTPDVYQGAPTPVTAFMSAATKTVALVVMFRVLVTAFPQEEHLWSVTLAVIACVSLAVGNFAALVQRNIKRLLAYSSISHAGFMLIPIATGSALGGQALVYYLIPYSVMSLGAFAVIAARERELGRAVTLDNLSGLGWERPFLGFSLAAFMFGFVGFPPLGLFIGKFYAFAAAYRHGWTWLVIVGVLATLVSLYYYLAVIRAVFMRSAAELQLAPVGGAPPREVLLQISVFACLAVAVASFFFVQPLVDLAGHAARSLPL